MARRRVVLVDKLVGPRGRSHFIEHAFASVPEWERLIMTLQAIASCRQAKAVA